MYSTSCMTVVVWPQTLASLHAMRDGARRVFAVQADIAGGFVDLLMVFLNRFLARIECRTVRPTERRSERALLVESKFRVGMNEYEAREVSLGGAVRAKNGIAHERAGPGSD